MRKLVVSAITVTVLVVAAMGLVACSSGSKTDGVTSSSAAPPPSTTTTTASATTLAPTTTAAPVTTIAPTTLPPTTSTVPVETSTSLEPATQLDSWHDLPLMEGADNITASDSELHYTVAFRSTEAHDFYMGVMQHLGYEVVSDAPSAPIHMTIYEKDSARYTMFIVPPTGGDGSEREAYIVIKRG